MTVSSSASLSQLKPPVLGGDLHEREISLDSYANSHLAVAISNTISDRRIALLKDLNEFAHSVMLSTAHAAQLDQVAALLGVKRLQLAAAEPNASPPKSAIMETDERLRMRAKLSMHALNQSGCEGSYRFNALSANANVKDVSVYSDELSEQVTRVNVVILSDQGRGNHEIEGGRVLQDVRQAVHNSSSITDNVIVRWATVFDYKVNAKLEIDASANHTEVIASAAKAARHLVQSKHRLGQNIIRDEFLSTLYQPGVNKVWLIEPHRDWAIADDCAPYNPANTDDKSLFSVEAIQQVALETEVGLATTFRAAPTVQLTTEAGDSDSKVADK